MMKRVVVGLSGGVDSSVAAYLLKQEGYEVIAIFMKNWHDESVTISNECPWVDDSNDALLVAEHLGIPFHTIDLSLAYKERIVDYMFAEYERGRTPNPDVLCNREIKFDVFLQYAQQLKADYVATGHYVKKETKTIEGKQVHSLLQGVDDNKDQSYFLCQLNQQQLSQSLFPIGKYTKSQVREIALEVQIPTANKKDSQGLCFIGKVKLPVFLQQQLAPKQGNIIEIEPNNEVFKVKYKREDYIQSSKAYVYNPEHGRVIGQHNGAHFYTIGQRKGLQVGGKEKPLFIIGIDTFTNTVYVGQGEDHPGLYRPALCIKAHDIHWLRPDIMLKANQNADYEIRIRYRQSLKKGKLFQTNDDLYILFENDQKSITSGQFAAWYNNGELIGSGIID